MWNFPLPTDSCRLRQIPTSICGLHWPLSLLILLETGSIGRLREWRVLALMKLCVETECNRVSRVLPFIVTPICIGGLVGIPVPVCIEISTFVSMPCIGTIGFWNVISPHCSDHIALQGLLLSPEVD